ncbi:MAG: hypothetical protein Kow0073_05260 [Immundisolibacter sp.]
MVLVLLAVWAVRDADRHRGFVAREAPLFPRLPEQAASVRRIEIVSASGRVTLHGRDAAWRVAEKHDFPASTAKVRALLEGLAGLVLIEPRTADPTRHAALDLNLPDAPDGRGVLVRVLGENGAALAQVLLGKPRAAAGQGPRQLYLRLPDDDQTWLAEGGVDVQRTPQLWLREDVMDLPQARVRRVRVEHPKQAPLLIARAAPGEDFALQAVPDDRRPRASGVGAAAYGLQHLPLQNVFKPDEVAGDWADAVQATFDTFDGLSVTASVLQIRAVPHVRLAATVAADATADQRQTAAARAERINKELADWVFVVPPHTAASFTPQLEDLLEPLATDPDASADSQRPPVLPGR